jgi:Mlc titration factor MtfA (ptsG expression regulator)
MMWRWLKSVRGRFGAKEVFPAQWTEVLTRRFPLYLRLDIDDQRELKSHIQWFLRRKRFEGCGGLEITDEIRVTIAAQACLLLLHRSRAGYRKLKSILVYPSTYFSENDRAGRGGVVSREESARLGESWLHGTVVLAWDSVKGGASNPFDGHNVVLHEFAHQLDQADGRADGAPVLGRGESFTVRRAAYSSWARVLSADYKKLKRDASRGRKTVLDTYGATNPAEFFAVATECFFEKPKQLKLKQPELYAELTSFYKQDPLGWGDPARPAFLPE